MGIPYSGSGVMASALAMDKLRSKHIWKGLGLPTPPYKLLQDSMSSEDLEAALAQLGGRVFVKPIAEGSSFGMAIASSSTELHDAFRQASLFNQPVMAERLVSGCNGPWSHFCRNAKHVSSPVSPLRRMI